MDGQGQDEDHAMASCIHTHKRIYFTSDEPRTDGFTDSGKKKKKEVKLKNDRFDGNRTGLYPDGYRKYSIVLVKRLLGIIYLLIIIHYVVL